MIRRRPTKRSIGVLRSRDIGIPPTHVASPHFSASHQFCLHRNRQFQSRPKRRDCVPAKADGQVTEIGSFNTGGTGVADPQGLLGPDDSDKEVIASPDGRLLFAVNQGSNSIAVFSVQHDGSLALVNHTAVGSGGTEPVSLSIADGRLYVVNRGDEIQGQTGTIAPTITVFNIGRDGGLTQDVAATTTLPVGLSPSQLLISSTSNLAFLDTFTPPPLNNVTEANEVVPYQIAANGKLVPVSSGGVGDPVTPPLALGPCSAPDPEHHLRRTYRGQSGRRLHIRSRRQSDACRYCLRSGQWSMLDDWSARTENSFILPIPARTASASSRWPILCTPCRSKSSCWAGRRIRLADPLPARNHRL